MASPCPFAAGHGLLGDDLDYFFGTSDIDFAAPAGRGLRFDALEGLLDGLRSRQKLLLLDTCNSGELDKSDIVALAGTLPAKARQVGARGVRKVGTIGAGELLRLQDELFADLRRGSGAAVISSAGGAEFAMESDQWKNGAFTYALLQGLRQRGADRGRTGRLTVAELRDLVVPLVLKLTQGLQRPTTRRESILFEAPLPRAPVEAAKSRQSAAQVYFILLITVPGAARARSAAPDARRPCRTHGRARLPSRAARWR